MPFLISMDLSPHWLAQVWLPGKSISHVPQGLFITLLRIFSTILQLLVNFLISNNFEHFFKVMASTVSQKKKIAMVTSSSQKFIIYLTWKQTLCQDINTRVYWSRTGHWFRTNSTRRDPEIEPGGGEWRQREGDASTGWGIPQTVTEMNVTVLEGGTLTPGIWTSIFQNCEADIFATEATHHMLTCCMTSTR